MDSPPSWLMDALLERNEFGGKQRGHKKRSRGSATPHPPNIKLGVALCTALQRDLPLDRSVLLSRRRLLQKKQQPQALVASPSSKQPKTKQNSTTVAFPRTKLTLLGLDETTLDALHQSFCKYFVSLWSAGGSARHPNLKNGAGGIVTSLLHSATRLEGCLVEIREGCRGGALLCPIQGTILEDKPTTFVVWGRRRRGTNIARVHRVYKSCDTELVLYLPKKSKVDVPMTSPLKLEDDEVQFVAVHIRAHKFLRYSG